MSSFDCVFIVCQGRSGGTALSHALGSLPGTAYLQEPLHPELLKVVEEQPERTPEHLRHHNVSDPWRGYASIPFDELRHQYRAIGAARTDQLAWLRWLSRRCEGRAVFKVCRFWGYLARLRNEFPRATFVHLAREFGDQWKSYSGLGFARDYFGEWKYGYLQTDPTGAGNWNQLTDMGFYQKVWIRSRAEGLSVADYRITLEDLRAYPAEVLGDIAELAGWSRGEGEKVAELVA